MRILIVTGFFDSNYLYREGILYDELVKNHEVLIISSNYALPQKPKGLPKNGNFNLIRFKGFRLKDIIFSFYLKELKKYNPEVIFTYDAQQGFGLLASIWGKLNNKIIYYDHELQEIPKSTLGFIRYIFLTKNFIRIQAFCSKYVYCVTPNAEKLLNSIGIRNIVKGNLHYSNNFSLSIYPGFNFNKDFKYLITSGFFSSEKKIEVIIQSFLEARNSDSSLKLIIAGIIENPETENFLDKFQDIHYTKKMISVEELNYLFKNADIGIWSKSTATIFESLKFNIHIILPHQGDTSHLKSKQINFIPEFSKKFLSSEIIKVAKKEKVNDHIEYSIGEFVKSLNL